MKANMCRNVGAAVVLLGSMGGASVAHAYFVNGALGVNANAVDVWRLDCLGGTAKVQARVEDVTQDTVSLGVLVARHIAGPPEKLKADFRVAVDGGGNSIFASDVPTVAGPKAYHVSIVKNKASVPAGTLEAYSSTMQCLDVNGVEILNVVPTLVQDK